MPFHNTYWCPNGHGKTVINMHLTNNNPLYECIKCHNTFKRKELEPKRPPNKNRPLGGQNRK